MGNVGGWLGGWVREKASKEVGIRRERGGRRRRAACGDKRERYGGSWR